MTPAHASTPTPPAPLWLDGPLGSELIAQGVPVGEVAQASLLHSARVLDLHKSYRDAGAERLLAHTFTGPALFAQDPGLGAEALAAGVQLACQVLPAEQVYLSLGPLPYDKNFAKLLVEQLRQRALAGLWFETFNEGSPHLDAWLAALCDWPCVVTLLPSAGPPSSLETRYPQAIATGFNCSPKGTLNWPDAPSDAGRARTKPFIVKPATRYGSQILADETLHNLIGKWQPDWIGLCCGGTPTALFELRQAVRQSP